MEARLKERLLPASALVSILAIWAAVVHWFEIPEYIVPSPFHVARTLVRDFDVIVRNLWPTAVESLLGFLFGNLASIVLATVFVH